MSDKQLTFGFGQGNQQAPPANIDPDKLAVKFPSIAWYFEHDEGEFLSRYLRKQKEFQESTDSEYLGMNKGAWESLGRRSYEQNVSDRKDLQDLCYKLYHKNPIAGNIIDNYCFYTLGKSGVEVIWENSDQAKKRWETLAERNKWPSFSKDIARMTFICGEDFVSLWPKSKEFKLDLRHFHPANIPEIKTKSGDPQTPTEYMLQQKGKSDQPWPANEIIHFKVRDVGPVLRGRPILERVIEALAWYHSFLEDRVNLMRMRSRLPIIRYVEGKPEGVPVKALPEPNTVLDEYQGNEWHYPELKLDSSNVKHDARELKLYIASGVSLPEYMTTMDASNANYSSTIVTESTPIALFKHLQGKLRATYKELIRKFMPDFADTAEFRISFPEVDLRNFNRKVDAVIKEFKAGLRSRRTSQLALDLDPDLEEKEMKEELGPIESRSEFKSLVESVMFHAPAVKNNGHDNGQALEKLVMAFDKKGWLDDES